MIRRHTTPLLAALFISALASCDAPRSADPASTEPATTDGQEELAQDGVPLPESDEDPVNLEPEEPDQVAANRIGADEPSLVPVENEDDGASALDAFVPRPQAAAIPEAEPTPAPTETARPSRDMDRADNDRRARREAPSRAGSESLGLALDRSAAPTGGAFGEGGGGRSGGASATGSRGRGNMAVDEEAPVAQDPIADARSVLQPIGNTNINLGGAQDFGLFRRRLDDNQVPQSGEFDASGFFAEHHTPLPPPTCGERVCLQPMLGVMANLHNGEPMTILQLGLNSPIEAVASERPPLTLSVVVDVSGSMESAGKIDFVRQGLELLIDSLHDGDQISIVTYSNRSETLFEMAGVSENRTELRRIARSLRAHGGTNLYDGLEEGYREVTEHYDSGRQNRVILLSDGQPTSGNTSTSAIWDMSERYNSEGVGLTTIGLGSSFNVDLMRGLSERGDGNFYFVEDAGAVAEVFSDEVSFFTVPVAFDLELEVEMGSQYEISAAHGSSEWESSRNGGSLEQESVFLAHRESHADVTETGGRRGGGSALILELQPRRSEPDPAVTSADVATVHVSFREPGTNRIVEDTVVVHYPGSPWAAPTTGYFYAPDPTIIQKSFLMLGLYQAMDLATQQFHQGNRNQAVGTIRRAMAAARDFNDSANGGGGDVDVALDLQLMQQLIDVLYRNGAAEPVALRLPQDPWPADRDL